ncbi:MAG: hypothetical protein GTO51_03235 [Candidatus Latescibacteria bacterium]|nr:hypothetical protein [Candidatus Latescibacterota bacterium]NIM22699.1 hypothetical protein [Candidatus Latescibacterota bacterium]NIM64988.1 hypothetical protein [Candidatus Latescibacterota bacterium]NIO01503.1 hypothetical protein [Candidatus Latescibacterota bacterium]NIO28012.1 hypothetical protein [Candidatus Latescibacterota bacterium]
MSVFRVFVCVAVLLIGLVSSIEANQKPAPTAAKTPVEFSNENDKEDNNLGCLGNLDPGQVLYTEAIDVPGLPYARDAFDYIPPNEVDAIASLIDYLFDHVIAGTVKLLVSFEDDPNGIAVYHEKIIDRDKEWYQTELVNGCGAGGINNLDGLNVRANESGDGSRLYSIVGDPNGVSVYYFTGGASVTYITRA